MALRNGILIAYCVDGMNKGKPVVKLGRKANGSRGEIVYLPQKKEI